MWKEWVKNSKIRLLIIAILSFTITSAVFFSDQKSSWEKPAPVPSVSIGCDRVIWKNTELELQASTSNIDAPVFLWTVDGKIAGSTVKIKEKLDIGEHQVTLNVSSGNHTLQAKQSTVVIDIIDGISLRDSQASQNQWGFQTVYRNKNFGVKGFLISLDSSPPQEVNPCGQLSTKGLSAGEHSWRAEFQGRTIASGTFLIKEVTEVKITKINVAPSYRAGNTVNGKIILKNTGTTAIKEFDIKTVIINHKYEWMGDKAKKELFDHYNSDIKPGETYDIPVQVTIPEKVSGIRPSGGYTITVNLILKGKIMDIKSVNTEVK